MTRKSLFSADFGVPIREKPGLKGLSIRLTSSIRAAALCVVIGTAFAFPAYGDENVTTAEATGTSVRIIEIEIGSNGFSESELTVGSGETVKFIVKNSGDVARDFTIGTEHVMERRRAFLAQKLTSDATDIDPLQRNKLDRTNAVIVLPGETRELTWKFVKTDGLEFASNIAGHYESGFKGGFRADQLADAKPQDTAAEPSTDETPVEQQVTAAKPQDPAPEPTTDEALDKEQVAKVEPEPTPSKPIVEHKTEAGVEQPEQTLAEVLPGPDTADASTEKPAQASEDTAPAPATAEADTDKPAETAEETGTVTTAASTQAEQPAQAPEEAAPSETSAETETGKPAEAVGDASPAVMAADTEVEQPAKVPEEAAPVDTAANTGTEEPAETPESIAPVATEDEQTATTSDEAAKVAETEDVQPAETADEASPNAVTAQAESQPEAMPQTAAIAPGATSGPASEEELVEAAGEAPKVPGVPIPLEKPKLTQDGEETVGDVAEQLYPSVSQHVRVSKLRNRGLKAKRERDRRRRARPGIQTNFNASRVTPVVSDQSGARQLSRNERGANSSRATSRAYDNDRVRAQEGDSVQRRVRRERNRFATDGFTLRGREDTIVDDFFDEDPNRVARHDLSATQFHAFSNRAAAEGYHPVYVDGYLTEGGVRFAGIWERRSKGRWIARHGLTSREYQSMYDRYTGEGYKLIHVSGYWDGSQEKYAAIWNR